jgi:1-acyl-sn-glycerol-3-phosphate acyltransferase
MGNENRVVNSAAADGSQPAAAVTPQAVTPQAVTPQAVTPQVARPGLARLLYGIGTWLQFLLLGAALVPVLLLTPGLARRRRLVRTTARLALRLAAMRLEVHGFERLRDPCIVVANHSSYLDGVVLCATLPPWFSFVIKREMARVPLAGTLLRRIGAEFVTRGARTGGNRTAGARDARRLLRQAESGHALVFFPEGTFGSDIGLRHFHIGAFAAAVRAGLPLLPVVIHGTRRCLPPDSAWPRPGTIRIEALVALTAHASASEQDVREHALQLRAAARAALLSVLGEPDLDPGARQ